MVNLFALPLLLLSSFLAAKPVESGDKYKNAMNASVNERGNYTLNSIDATGLGSEMRIYRYDDMLIDEISDNAFDGTSFTTLALSNCVTHISDAAFTSTSIQVINYTGSLEEYNALGLTHEFQHVYEYMIDEGFINYWNAYVRPNADSNICSITRETYNKVLSLYLNLSTEDLAVVDSHIDKANVKIKDSIKELNNVFGEITPTKKTEEWNQTGAIILIIFIAVLGMTSITVFFLLKTKNIIK